MNRAGSEARVLELGARPAARALVSVPAGGGRSWRCQACATLLGVERAGELHVKHKEADYWIRGRCRHTCRRCGRENVVVVGTPAPEEGP